MYTWSKRARLPKTESSTRAQQRALLGKRPLSLLGTLFFVPLLLTGCADRAVSGGLGQQPQEAVPDAKVVDYHIAPCDTLWQLDAKDALNNSLYWLRAMDCAERIGAPQARVQARTLPAASWDGALKQSILLSSAEPTPTERRQMLDRLNGYRLDFPSSLRPLLQLWRQQQQQQVALAEERLRYQRLQENSDNQVDALRQSQARLQKQLQETSRKLENLTDIERRLSSRKQLQGELPDNGASQGKAGNGTARNAAEPESQPARGTAIPVEPEDTYAPPEADKESDAQ